MLPTVTPTRLSRTTVRAPGVPAAVVSFGAGATRSFAAAAAVSAGTKVTHVGGECDRGDRDRLRARAAGVDQQRLPDDQTRRLAGLEGRSLVSPIAGPLCSDLVAKSTGSTTYPTP